MIDRFQVIDDNGPCADGQKFQHIGDAHDDVAADVETCTATGNDAYLRLMLPDEGADLGRQDRIASEIEAGLARLLNQVANAMFHQPSDQTPAVRATDGTDCPVQKGYG